MDVKQLFSGSAPVLDELHPKLLKALEVVGLSLLTRLYNIVWTTGTGPLEWQTSAVVPLLKKGDQRACSNDWGNHTPQTLREGLLQGAGGESGAS